MACFQIMFHDAFAAGHWSMARTMHVQDDGQVYVRFMFKGPSMISTTQKRWTVVAGLVNPKIAESSGQS